MNEDLETMPKEKNGCCGGMNCNPEVDNQKSAPGAAGAISLVFSALTFLLVAYTTIAGGSLGGVNEETLRQIVREEVIYDQALKAGGVDNYNRLNDEIYKNPLYIARMQQEIDAFIQQTKMQLDMMQNPGEGGAEGQLDEAALQQMIQDAQAQEAAGSENSTNEEAAETQAPTTTTETQTQ